MQDASTNRNHLDLSSIPPFVRDIIRTDSFLARLPGADEVSPVPGGVSHSVYLMRCGEARYFLKIRGDRFARIPEILCNPDDIAVEYAALSLFHELASENFPRVLAFDEKRHYMVLSDAMPNGVKLEAMFLQHTVTSPILFTFGQTLKQIHVLASTYRQDLRMSGDQGHYDIKLQHRFGYRHNHVLDRLVISLREQGNRHLILGDVAPKNIGVNDGGTRFIFFDLEEAHRGDAVFDYGYFLGHILVHTITMPLLAEEAINSYIRGYGEPDFDEGMVKQIALGTVLYRLGSIIPYPTCLSPNQRIVAQKQIEDALLLNLTKTTWGEILSIVQP